MRSTLLLAAVLAVSATAQEIRLGDVPALAAARAERQRPAQLAALEPFLHDLKLDHDRSKQVVDDAIDKVMKLGDGIIPLLLERLSPAAATPDDLNLADNSARILARLEPETFVEALIDLARGDDTVARRHALELLGRVDDARARETIAAVYPSLSDPQDQRIALRAAERQKSPLLRDAAVDLASSTDTDTRSVAVRYLASIADPTVKDTMLAVFAKERDDHIVGACLDYFAATAKADPAVTDAIVAAITAGRLDGDRLIRTITALRTIAPEDHREARRVLREILERGTTGPLGIATALTLDALGDARADRILFDQLDERVKRRRTDPDVYVDRAEAYIAFDRWRDAIRDYELAIRYTNSRSRRGVYYLQIARCEAHRDSVTRMVRALEDSELGAETIRREAAKDPVFAEAVAKDSVSRFLDKLGR